MQFTAESVLPDWATCEDKISQDLAAEEAFAFNVAAHY